MYEHTYIVHVRICVILYECTIICVYMGTCIYCIYIKSVCSTCAYSFLYVSIIQVNYITKTALLEHGFTIKNKESFTPGVVVLPRKLFCCCIHKR